MNTPVRVGETIEGSRTMRTEVTRSTLSFCRWHIAGAVAADEADWQGRMTTGSTSDLWWPNKSDHQPMPPQRMLRVGILPASTLPPQTRSSILSLLDKRGFPWVTRRHSHFPTTDIEARRIAHRSRRAPSLSRLRTRFCISQVHAFPWLDRAMAGLLRSHVFPSIAATFEVDESRLFLRDQFLVKYEAGRQQLLRRHRQPIACRADIHIHTWSE